MFEGRKRGVGKKVASGEGLGAPSMTLRTGGAEGKNLANKCSLYKYTRMEEKCLWQPGGKGGKKNFHLRWGRTIKTERPYWDSPGCHKENVRSQGSGRNGFL